MVILGGWVFLMLRVYDTWRVPRATLDLTEPVHTVEYAGFVDADFRTDRD